MHLDCLAEVGEPGMARFDGISAGGDSGEREATLGVAAGFARLAGGRT